MITSRRFKRIALSFVIIGILMISGCGDSENPSADELGERMGVEFSLKDAGEEIRANGVAQWTYVTLGDSLNMTYPSMFQEMMEEDLGVKITYVRRWIGGDHSSELLNRLQSSESLREDLRTADVITFDIPYNVFEKPCQFACGELEDGCEGLTSEECIAKAAETYMADTDAILAELDAICDSSKTLIRTMDAYQFFVGEAKDTGAFIMINQYWRECNEHLIAEAAKYNIPTIRTYDAFMGESGEEDPMDSNLVYNGKNQTEEGARVVAELFREVGYFYAPEK